MIIEAFDLWKKFGRVDALKGATFSVPDGSAFALIGANGAGKTTTIKLLMNMIEPSRGRATVMGVDTRKISPAELARIGYVSENQEMPQRLTVGEFLDYLRPFYPTWDRTLEAAILRQFRLPLDRKIRDLSHGMRVKLALACALPYRPKLLVLDEPFSGIDPLVRDEFMAELLRQAGETTIFISSHELNEIEGMATHVGFLEEGKLLFQESMESLTARVREVRVTLDHEATLPAQRPSEWLNMEAAGSVVTFVHTHYSEETLRPQIASVFGPVRHVEIRALPLRTIFVALARAAQERSA